MMRVALYARVSRHDKDQDPRNQLIRLREFAKARGWTVYDEYPETASGAQLSRPILNKMLREAHARRFDAIIVVRIDRIGRSVRHLHNLLDDLQHCGIDLICSDQPFDTSSSAGRLLRNILGDISEFELDLIRERTKDGLARARAQGKRLGRPPNQAKTDEIRRLRAQGFSLRQIGELIGMTKQGVRQRLRRDRLQKRVENQTCVQ